MISRICCASLTRSINKTWRSQSQSLFYLSSTFSRNLYLKTYDKDDGNRADNLRSRKEFRQNNFETDKGQYYSENDPDTFGPRFNSSQLPYDEDPGDVAEKEFLENPPDQSHKLQAKDYARLIKEHLNNNRIKEAIDILEVTMKADRFPPEKYIYNLLISGCAKAGYSKKAFQLFNKMKQRSLKPSASTYTSLFNACANAPWSLDGLNKANHLRELMLQKGFEPNVPNYNAMIKAFGRCGDVKTAYLLADEMLDKKMRVTSSTFNFLLQACASDKEFGFRHALLTWHKMKSNKISPDIYSFGIMLRCVRDCSIGDLATVEEVLSKILSGNKAKSTQLEKNTTAQLTDSTKSVEVKPDSGTNELIVVQTNNSFEEQDQTPNLISDTPHLGSLISISEIINPHDRLLLLGGFTGFMNELQKEKITPNIKMFTTLLEVIPSTKVSEKQLIAMVRKIGIKCDIDFFNILIKKRSMRFDYEGAKEVLNMIKTAKLQPDIVTYGVLALSCQTQDEARELLHQMFEKGIRMNIQILGAMLRQGTAQRNFQYVNEILEISLDENIKPNESFLKHLDHFRKQCTKLIENRHPLTRTKNFHHNLKTFDKKLKIWYEEHHIAGLQLQDAIKKISQRPYEQFKEKQSPGFEQIKNEEFMRKQKVKKYINKIKINDLKEDEEGNISSRYLER